MASRELTLQEKRLLEKVGRIDFYKLKREKELDRNLNFFGFLIKKFGRFLRHKLAVAIFAIVNEKKDFSELEKKLVVKKYEGRISDVLLYTFVIISMIGFTIAIYYKLLFA